MPNTCLPLLFLQPYILHIFFSFTVNVFALLLCILFLHSCIKYIPSLPEWWQSNSLLHTSIKKTLLFLWEIVFFPSCIYTPLRLSPCKLIKKMFLICKSYVHTTLVATQEIIPLYYRYLGFLTSTSSSRLWKPLNKCTSASVYINIYRVWCR